MESNTTRKHGRFYAVVLTLFAICMVIVALGVSTDILSPLKPYLSQLFTAHRSLGSAADQHNHSDKESPDEHEHDEKKEAGHEGHNHESEEKENANSLSLDDASLFNIGIKKDGELTLKLQQYEKSFRMPGVVREIPGRSINNIAATVSGIVTKVEAKQGDSLCPGAPLLEIQ
ncbi:MAG: hypothetical protein Q4G59_04415, partial [Planctomycetia bacterium]|nr:hypothetical protein [Planctomycetia bacterium]